MRRSDREITDIDEVFRVIDDCPVVRLAMADGGKPYIVPLNFGYDRQGDTLTMYFHSAMEGRKMDIWRASPQVYFEMDTANEFVPAAEGDSCAWSWRFDSVMGSGEVEFITDVDGKTHALNRIIAHLGHSEKQYTFPEKMIERTCAYKVVSRDFTGKRHK